MRFSHTGTYVLGILRFQDVKRTYCSDSEWVEHDWVDIENIIDDVTNTITVNQG